MIVIIDGCGANISSVQLAIERLGKEAVYTSDPEVIKAASHVILPGVGTAHKALQKLEQLQLIPVLRRLTQPVLGICLGMQILHEFSSEGDVDCLNILPGKVEILPRNNDLPIPHMGWNRLIINNTQSALLKGVENNTHVYFVHSYCASINHNTVATTHYTKPFSAIVQHKNFYGIQFHPERSGYIGRRILQNFLEINA